MNKVRIAVGIAFIVVGLCFSLLAIIEYSANMNPLMSHAYTLVYIFATAFVVLIISGIYFVVSSVRRNKTNL